MGEMAPLARSRRITGPCPGVIGGSFSEFSCLSALCRCCSPASAGIHGTCGFQAQGRRHLQHVVFDLDQYRYGSVSGRREGRKVLSFSRFANKIRDRISVISQNIP